MWAFVGLEGTLDLCNESGRRRKTSPSFRLNTLEVVALSAGFREDLLDESSEWKMGTQSCSTGRIVGRHTLMTAVLTSTTLQNATP